MIMKKHLILILCLIIPLLSSCDPYPSKHHPITNPNTRWVSENPNMFFEIDDFANPGDLIAKVSYAQIIKDDEVIELILSFDYSGGSVIANELSARLPDGGILGGNALFQGLCKSSAKKLVVTIERNDRGFLDESIKEITFVREDLN